MRKNGFVNATRNHSKNKQKIEMKNFRSNKKQQSHPKREIYYRTELFSINSSLSFADNDVSEQQKLANNNKKVSEIF